MHDKNSLIPADNICELMQQLSVALESHFAALRKGSHCESLRKSDVKVFFLASRQPRSMATMARDLGVSRQAIHESVKRLVALDIVELEIQSDNGRDKVVAVTELGKDAQILAQTSIAKLESTGAEILGKEEFELFRKMLGLLLHGFKQVPVPQIRATSVKSTSSGSTSKTI